MSSLNEFSYSDIIQRKIIYLNSFVSTSVLGYLFFQGSLSLLPYFFYYPILKVVIVSLLAGVFLGNVIGRILFKYVKAFRLVYIIAEILFILSISLFLAKELILPESILSLIGLFHISPYLIPLIFFIPGLFMGIKTNYFMKISCGDFIDDKQGIILFISFFLLGIASGVLLGIVTVEVEIIKYFILVLPVLLIPSLFLIKLSYNPEPIFAQNYDEDLSQEQQSVLREDLFFTYLNFSYILIYIYLGYEAIIKFYGDIFINKISFIPIASIAIIIGLVLGKLFKIRFWHIYAEMTFPVFFIIYIFLIFNFSGSIPFYYGIMLFVPSLIIFGFSLYHTIKNLINHFDHKKRFSIIDFSIMILPVPILIAISFINFSNLWYFIFLYLISFLNIIIPGLYLFQHEAKGYKKLLYFVFSLIFIPVLIFNHLLFKIPLNSNRYIQKTENFDHLKNVNYNQFYIKNNAKIQYNRTTIFRISDSIIRNQKRSLIPVYFHQPIEKNSEVLFIDGNQKFFRNPVISYFKNARCIETISQKNIDYNSLPVSGRQNYIPEEKYLQFFLYEASSLGKRYDTIVSLPNILDQNRNRYLFSKGHYNKLKTIMTKDGIYAQCFDLNESNPELFSFSVKNIRDSFKNHVVYLFSNIIIILSSDSDESFLITEKHYEKINTLLEERKDYQNLFYTNSQFLSHILFTDINDFIPFISKENTESLFTLFRKPGMKREYGFIENYLEKNNQALNLIIKNRENRSFLKSLKKEIKSEKKILTLLKKTELQESVENYTGETEFLFNLTELKDKSSDFRSYLNKIMTYKEQYYFDAAKRYKKIKQWDKSRILYEAILNINNKNFEANYQLGVLYVTLQDIEKALKYFKQAMKLKKNHPKVLFQMGVLLFASDKIDEAIDFFEKAIDGKERSASLFLYLGLCYEKQNKIGKAEEYYKKALFQDPNDIDINARLKNIRMLIEKKKKRWKSKPKTNQTEVEEGEDMPLPINKNALKVRLKDKDK